MSAVNIYQDGAAVEIWTDACAYDTDGEILALLDKIILLEDVGAAIAVQGDLRLLSALQAGMPGAYETFDSLVDNLADMATGIGGEVAGKAFLPTIIKAVGYSDERKRLEVWSVAVGDTVHHPSGPAQMLPSGRVSVSPCSSDLLARLGRSGLMDGADLHCDTHAERLAIIRAQRETPFPYEVANGRAIRMVGGRAQRTVVRKGSVSTEVVERWPDVVGPRGRAALAA